MSDIITRTVPDGGLVYIRFVWDNVTVATATLPCIPEKGLRVRVNGDRPLVFRIADVEWVLDPVGERPLAVDVMLKEIHDYDDD
jgi:hypothetical protein